MMKWELAGGNGIEREEMGFRGSKWELVEDSEELWELHPAVGPSYLKE